jgi:hypothetical protein
LVDVHFPEADVIRLVVANLNTHTPAALYEPFRPEEARRLTRKLEFYSTPKHGSWLNMAECAFAVLTQQCLDRRLPDIATLGEKSPPGKPRVIATKRRSTGALARLMPV